jgi:hypothetical protein
MPNFFGSGVPEYPGMARCKREQREKERSDNQSAAEA